VAIKIESWAAATPTSRHRQHFYSDFAVFIAVATRWFPAVSSSRRWLDVFSAEGIFYFCNFLFLLLPFPFFFFCTFAARQHLAATKIIIRRRQMLLLQLAFHQNIIYGENLNELWS